MNLKRMLLPPLLMIVLATFAAAEGNPEDRVIANNPFQPFIDWVSSLLPNSNPTPNIPIASPSPSAPPSSAESVKPSTPPSSVPSATPSAGPTENAQPSSGPTASAQPSESSSPSSPPSETPVALYDPCSATNPLVQFVGAQNAMSFMEGQIKLDWLSPLVMSTVAFFNQSYTGRIDDIFPVGCGKFSYKVFVYEGGDWTIDNTTTVEDLMTMVDVDPKLSMIETTEKALNLTGLIPGMEYSILVRGMIENGPRSRNYVPVVVTASTSDPVIRSNYTDMKVLSYPVDDIYTVQYLNETFPNMLRVTGADLPAVLDTVDIDDYLHVVANDLTTYIFRIEDVLESDDGLKLFQVVVAPLTAIFETLELSGEQGTDEEEFDDITPEQERLVLARLQRYGDEQLYKDLCEDFEEETDFDFCVATLNGSADDRRSLHQRRRLLGGWCRGVVRHVEKAAETFVKVVEDIVEVVEEVADAVVEFAGKVLELELVSVNNREKELFSIEPLTTRFSLSVAISKQTASFTLAGGFGFKGYVLLGASASQSYEPDPLKLLSLSRDISIFIGPVPVIITLRSNLEAFFAASVSIEGIAFAGFGKGYVFSVGFDFDSGRSGNKFRSIAPSFEEDELDIPGPVFDVRARADLETGLTFGFDVVLYALLQGSVAADLGVSAGMEVGANLDTILVTRPYIVSLNEFGITAFVNVRLFVGLNTAITDFLADLLEGLIPATPVCEISLGTFEFPDLEELLEEEEDEEESALEMLSGTIDETIMTFEDIESVEDLFQVVLGAEELYVALISSVANVLREGVGEEFEVFAKEIPIVALPNITIEADETDPVQYCVGDNAISLKLGVSVESDGLIETGISNSNGVWFGNFDDEYFPLNEDDWEITGGPSGATANLKRTSMMALYELNPNATVFFRGTPDLLPIPRVMLASEVVSELFDDVESFECCESSDCELKFPDEDRGFCLDSMCIASPSSQPSTTPTSAPSQAPSGSPSSSQNPSARPSLQPSGMPSSTPTEMPSSKPSVTPSADPTVSMVPSSPPTMAVVMEPFEISVQKNFFNPCVVPDGFIGRSAFDLFITSGFSSSALFAPSSEYPCEGEPGSRAILRTYFVFPDDRRELIRSSCRFQNLPMQNVAIFDTIPFTVCGQLSFPLPPLRFQVELFDQLEVDLYTSDVVTCESCDRCVFDPMQMGPC